MKILTTAYAFNAISKTITFSAPIPATISDLLLVTNSTRGVIYFLPQNGFSGTYSGGVLTLAGSVSTAGHADTDKLQIFMEDGSTPSSATGQASQLIELQAINADLGAPTDAPADSPTATAGIGPLLRLGLQGLATALTNWTTLLGRIPELNNGAVPVLASLDTTDLVPPLRQLVAMATAPAGFDRSLGRQRGTAIIESGTITTVSTVSTVTSLGTCTTVGTVGDQTSIGGRPAQMLINQTNISAWAQSHRSLIS